MIDYAFIDELYWERRNRQTSAGDVWTITLSKFRELCTEQGITAPLGPNEMIRIRRLKHNRRIWSDDNFRVYIAYRKKAVIETPKRFKEAQTQSDANGVRKLSVKQWVSELEANKANQHK